MAVGGERARQAEFTHDREAGAVGEGELLVLIAKKQFAAGLESGRVDSLPAKARAGVDLLPPRIRRGESEPEANQGERFVRHEVGRDQA